MSAISRIIVSTWLSLVTVAPLAAQGQDPIPPLHDRFVRVHTCADSSRVVGTVTVQSESILTLISLGEPRPIPISDIGRIQIRGQDRGRWATIGIFLGAAGGAIGHRMVKGSDGYTGLVSLFIAAPIGALVGGMAGAMLAPEEWVTFRLLACRSALLPLSQPGASGRAIAPVH